MNGDNTRTEKITEQDRQLIQIMRDIGFGQMVITVKDGKPVHVEEIRRSIQIK